MEILGTFSRKGAQKMLNLVVARLSAHSLLCRTPRLRQAERMSFECQQDIVDCVSKYSRPGTSRFKRSATDSVPGPHTHTSSLYSGYQGCDGSPCHRKCGPPLRRICTHGPDPTLDTK